MAPLRCDCPHCRCGFEIDDDAILDAIGILHEAGMEAAVTCPKCSMTLRLPPPRAGGPS